MQREHKGGDGALGVPGGVRVGDAGGWHHQAPGRGRQGRKENQKRNA